MYVFLGRPRPWRLAPIHIIQAVRWLLGYPPLDLTVCPDWFIEWDRRLSPWCLWISAVGERFFPTSRAVRIDEWDLRSPRAVCAIVLPPLLRAFRDRILCAPALDEADVPAGMQKAPQLEQWQYLIGEMAWAVEQPDEQFMHRPPADRDALRDRHRRGLALLAKYYCDMWG